MGPLPTERVLIADADASLCLQLSRRLLDQTVFADSVPDGRMAVQLLSEQRYGVVVLDLTLPHAGAERVLEAVRDMAASNRPVVLMLAEPSAAQSLDFDFVQIVLRKPCDLPQLALLVRSCVDTGMTYCEPPPLDLQIAV